MQELEIRNQELDFRATEAFKILRTNIEFSGGENKTITITSAMPNEGKSSVAFHLATSFAFAGKKTLLIDADLRKSVMRSRYIKGSVKGGLTNYLAGQMDLSEVLHSTNIENFYLIAAGPVPPNPSELLGSTRFQKMMEGARRTFDIVIVDAPPIGSVIDAAVAAKSCDGIVVVMAAGQISAPFAKKIKEQLATAGVKVLGCVLNKVDFSNNSYYGKYYGNYYGKYGQEE